jgi:hypothetical protein
LRYLWAGPTSMMGLMLVPLAARGGQVSVVVGRDARALAACRAHERAHVKQCERWGRRG